MESVASSTAYVQGWHVTIITPNRMTIAVIIENALAANLIMAALTYHIRVPANWEAFIFIARNHR